MLSPLARLKTSHYASFSPDWAQLLSGSCVPLCWIEWIGDEEGGAVDSGAREFSLHKHNAGQQFPQTTILHHFAACGYSRASATTAAKGQATTQGCGMMHGHKHITHTNTHKHTHTLNDTGTWWTISGLPICSSVVLGACAGLPTVQLTVKVKVIAAWYTVSLSLPQTQTHTHMCNMKLLLVTACLFPL